MSLATACLAGGSIAVLVLDLATHRSQAAFGGLALLFGLLSALIARVASRPERVWGSTVMLALAAVGTAADHLVAAGWYRELHDLSWFAGMLGLMVLARRLRSSIMSWSRARLGIALGLSIAFSVAALWSADRVSPGWRVHSVRDGRQTERLARLLRFAVDLDSDEFSPFFWGGDCDDLDDSKHPLAFDEPGAGDRNCNGVEPPSSPTDHQRGLLPPVGDADMPDGEVELVLVVIIDAWRGDAFNAVVTPNVWRFSRHGLRLHRCYAAGTRTRLSLPLLQRTTARASTIAEQLREGGFRSTAVPCFTDRELYPHLAGFSRQNRTKVSRSADEITSIAMSSLEGESGPHYLWLHYCEPHDPYRPEVETPLDGVETRGADHLRYLQEVASVDRELEPLLAAIERDWLARSVVILTGDHGEGFGEHGVVFHGTSGYEQVARVPCIVTAPGLEPADVQHLASHRDIPPTILGAFGMVGSDPDIERYGRSWLRWRGEPRQPLRRFAVVRTLRAASGNRVHSPMLALVEERYKLIFSLEDSLTELYDLGDDERELHELSASHPEDVARLRRDLAVYADIERLF